MDKRYLPFTFVLSPVFAKIIEQGNRENIFNAERPFATMQFLLTGSQFLLDDGLFKFSADEHQEQLLVTQGIVEKALGAEHGTFDFMTEETPTNE